MQQLSTRRGATALAAIVVGGCLAAGPAEPAVASTWENTAHAAPAAWPADLAGLVRSVFQNGARAVRPATRSTSARTAGQLADDAGAARSAVGTAESASASRGTRASANAGRLAPETVEVRLQRWAAEDGPEILRETECALIWDQMYSDEQAAVEETVGLERAGAESGDPVTSASAEAIANVAVRRAARVVGRPVYLTAAWMQWAQGVRENATAALGGSQGVVGLRRTVELDDGVVSLALIGYARHCLQPPR